MCVDLDLIKPSDRCNKCCKPIRSDYAEYGIGPCCLDEFVSRVIIKAGPSLDFGKIKVKEEIRKLKEKKRKTRERYMFLVITLLTGY